MLEGVLSFLSGDLMWLAGGGVFALAIAAVVIDVPPPLKGWAVAAVIAVAGVISTMSQRENYLSAKAEVAEAEARRQQDVANAERLAREAREQDAATTAGIVAQLNNDKADLEGRLNDAEVSLAKAAVFETSPGCPDVMASPAVRAFLRGLPADAPGKAGAGGARDTPGPGSAVPARPAPSLRIPEHK